MHHDAIVCLIVDRRYRQEKDRIWDLFGHHPLFQFYVDGDGRLLPRDLYDQVTRHDIPKSWGSTPGMWQHYNALRAIIMRASSEGWDNVLFVEDDVDLMDDFPTVVEAASLQLDGLPPWDMLYYGANHNNARTSLVAPNVLRVDGSLTTHMVAFRHTVYDAILNGLPLVSTDVALARHIHPRFNCYAAWPSVATQRPGYSYLWNQQVDYRDLFASKGVLSDPGRGVSDSA